MRTKIHTSNLDFIRGMIPVVLIVLIASVSFQSCQRDDFGPIGDNVLKTALIPSEDSTLYWGHRKITRETAKPFTETMTISGADLGYFEGCLKLKIKNGDKGMNLVDNAQLKIDGEIIVSPGDFETDPILIAREICGKSGNFTLEIQLRGKPGGFLDVWIEGKLKPNIMKDLRDGHFYKTVKIGDQIWMAENLKATEYNDGKAIPNVVDNFKWQNSVNGAYCWYNNDSANYMNLYGALYNWYAVNTGKLCPAGWHVPKDGEWTVLAIFLGGEYVAGGKMKSVTGWNSPNYGATNSSGFSALPGGFRNLFGAYGFIGENSFWWTSTENTSSSAWYRVVNFGGAVLYRHPNLRQTGHNVRCLRDNVTVPCVITSKPDSVTKNSAVLGGEVVFDGGNNVTERGICYATTPDPTISGKKKTMGSGEGKFSGKLTDLAATTKYYVRAYAINSLGTSYGDEVIFVTLTGNPSGTFMDARDGMVYKWVQIGTQVWMEENLKATLYNDGTAMPNVADNSKWQNSTNGAYCWYNNDSANYMYLFGTLYNWYAVNTGKLCPVGWHVPSDAEWATFENYLIASGYNFDGTTAGNKIAKSLAATAYWASSTVDGSVGNTDYPEFRNKTGFTALPGGYRDNNFGFFSIKETGGWWCSTEEAANYAWSLLMGYPSIAMQRKPHHKNFGFSVRCLRN